MSFHRRRSYHGRWPCALGGSQTGPVFGALQLDSGRHRAGHGAAWLL